MDYTSCVALIALLTIYQMAYSKILIMINDLLKYYIYISTKKEREKMKKKEILMLFD